LTDGKGETLSTVDGTADTKTRILDAAEDLFAENGVAETSLRAITAAAEVNLAAVHYHFHSKEGLVEEVFRRRLAPVNRERLEMLDRAEQNAGGDVPPLEAIVEAFVAPALRMARDPQHGPLARRLVGRAFTEPGDLFQERMRRHFGVVRDRFQAAVRRALPDLPERDLFWRLHVLVGAMAHTMADSTKLRFLSDGVCDADDVDAAVRQLVHLGTALLTAPPLPPDAEESP
jgi:AcrR family transcriptional regulator